jgi:RecA-family ATPase
LADPIELDDFLKRQPVILKPIISNGILYEGSKAIIYGKYKSLKSMLAIRLCLSVIHGDKWLGFDTVATDVLYLQLEIVEPMLQERLKTMLVKTTVGNGVGIPNSNSNGNAPKPKKLWLWTEKTIKIDTQEGFDRVSAEIGRFKPGLVVIDPIYKIVSGDLLSTNHIQKLTDWLDSLMDAHGISIVLVHHSRKGSGEETWGSDNMLGSSIFNNWADSIIEIQRQSFSDVLVKFENIRHSKTDIGGRYFSVDLSNLSFNPSGRTV